MTLRLFEKRSDILKELDDFLSSEKFNRCIAEKFGVDFDACYIDGGIQKYLDGYEISPHPDIRRKALTFMVNINPADDSESLDHHTHYLRFTPERDYIRRFWEGNADVERCWVPWEWCETVKQQRDNNSIVLFSPNNETMHGVKAAYNHLRTQRTQLYGNLWYQECPQLRRMEWEDLELGASRTIGKMSAREALKTLVPESVKPALKKLVTRNRGDIGHRDVRELD